MLDDRAPQRVVHTELGRAQADGGHGDHPIATCVRLGADPRSDAGGDAEGRLGRRQNGVGEDAPEGQHGDGTDHHQPDDDEQQGHREEREERREHRHRRLPEPLHERAGEYRRRRHRHAAEQEDDEQQDETHRVAAEHRRQQVGHDATRGARGAKIEAATHARRRAIVENRPDDPSGADQLVVEDEPERRAGNLLGGGRVARAGRP